MYTEFASNSPRVSKEKLSQFPPAKATKNEKNSDKRQVTSDKRRNVLFSKTFSRSAMVLKDRSFLLLSLVAQDERIV